MPIILFLIRKYYQRFIKREPTRTNQNPLGTNQNPPESTGISQELTRKRAVYCAYSFQRMTFMDSSTPAADFAFTYLTGIKEVERMVLEKCCMILVDSRLIPDGFLVGFPGWYLPA